MIIRPDGHTVLTVRYHTIIDEVPHWCVICIHENFSQPTHTAHKHSTQQHTQHTRHSTFPMAVQYTFISNNPDFEILKNFQVLVSSCPRASIGNTKINFELLYFLNTNLVGTGPSILKTKTTKEIFFHSLFAVD